VLTAPSGLAVNDSIWVVPDRYPWILRLARATILHRWLAVAGTAVARCSAAVLSECPIDATVKAAVAM
jgi:hypothetical protein